MQKYIVSDPESPRNWRVVTEADNGKLSVLYMYKNPTADVLLDSEIFPDNTLLRMWAMLGLTVTKV